MIYKVFEPSSYLNFLKTLVILFTSCLLFLMEFSISHKTLNNNNHVLTLYWLFTRNACHIICAHHLHLDTIDDAFVWWENALKLLQSWLEGSNGDKRVARWGRWNIECDSVENLKNLLWMKNSNFIFLIFSVDTPRLPHLR